MCILWQLAFSIFLRFILVDKTAVPHSFPLLPSISQFIYSPPYWQVLELSLLFHSGWCYEHFWHSFLVYRRKFVKDISEMELVDCWVTVRLLNRIKFELEDNFKPFLMHLHNLYIYSIAIDEFSLLQICRQIWDYHQCSNIKSVSLTLRPAGSLSK